MVIIYFILIVLAIGGIGLLINKPFREQLNAKFHGRTEAIMEENASTPEGARDIFNAAIQEKDKKYQQANNLYIQAEGKLDAAKKNRYEATAQLNKVEKEMNRCIDEGLEDDAKQYASKKVTLEKKLEIYKDDIASFKEDVAQKKEIKEALYKELQDLKDEKEVTLTQLESDQSRIDAMKGLEGTSTSENDRMLEKVRQGSKKKREMANGARIAYENSEQAAEYRLKERERESEVDRVLAEAKAKRNKK